MDHKRKTAGGKIGPLEIVRFLLNSCCGVSQDDRTTPQSPQEMLEFLVEAASLQHSLLLQTFLGSYSRAFSQYIASREKKRLHHMQGLCCRFQDPLYTGT